MELMFQCQLTEAETRVYNSGKAGETFSQIESNMSIVAEAAYRMEPSKPIGCQIVDNTGVVLKKW